MNEIKIKSNHKQDNEQNFTRKISFLKFQVNKLNTKIDCLVKSHKIEIKRMQNTIDNLNLEVQKYKNQQTKVQSENTKSSARNVSTEASKAKHKRQLSQTQNTISDYNAINSLYYYRNCHSVERRENNRKVNQQTKKTSKTESELKVVTPQNVLKPQFKINSTRHKNTKKVELNSYTTKSSNTTSNKTAKNFKIIKAIRQQRKEKETKIEQDNDSNIAFLSSNTFKEKTLSKDNLRNLESIKNDRESVDLEFKSVSVDESLMREVLDCIDSEQEMLNWEEKNLASAIEIQNCLLKEISTHDYANKFEFVCYRNRKLVSTL